MSTDDDDAITVATFTDIMEAEIACAALNAAGIPAEIPAEGAFLNRSEGLTQSLKIRVFASDREEALKFLRKPGMHDCAAAQHLAAADCAPCWLAAELGLLGGPQHGGRPIEGGL